MGDEYVEVSWYVDDGYVGKTRPQHTDIALCDIEDDMTDEEIEGFVLSVVQEEFEVNVSFEVEHLSQVVSELKRLRGIGDSNDP